MSDTDWYCTEFDIEVQCMVNTDYLGVLLPTQVRVEGTQYNPADIMREVRVRLLARRKTLSVLFNGVELMPTKAGGVPGTVDAKNGPVPQFCRIMELTNTTFFIHYGIKAHYWEKYTGGLNAGSLGRTNQEGNPILYNRWTEQVTFDGCQFSTRIRSGKFAIRSDNTQGLTADELRPAMAVLSVPKGFLRKKSDYKVDPSGLALEYTIMDEEQFKMPPAPAFEAEGYYEEESPRGSANRTATVTVQLKGSKTTSQADLVTAAARVCRDKLLANAFALPGAPALGGPGLPAGDKKAVPIKFSVRVDMFKNSVQVTSVFLTGVPRGRFKNFVWTNNQDLTFTPLSSPDYTPPYSDRGSALLLLQAAAYFDPSLANNPLAAGVISVPVDAPTLVGGDKVNMQTGLQPGEAGAQAE